MSAAYTFDVLCSLDGFGSYDGGDWGGYWGRQGPEFLDRRLALYGEEQRIVFGANTYRQMVGLLGSGIDESELDRTRPSRAVTPSTSSPGSSRSPTYRCAPTAACR